MDHRKEIREYLLSHQGEMLEELMSLMRIDSSLAQAEDGAPFGRGGRECFDQMINIAGMHGFTAKNYDYYAMAVDMNEKPRKLDVLCHLDVVPGQEGWKKTSPFEPKIIDGRLYGRGSSDDKGPAIAALYAMRAVRDLGIAQDHNIRLILGGDEETEELDMEYYFEREPHAPATISPDSSFPVVNVEKGSMAAPFELDLFDNLESGDGFFAQDIQAGIASNMVPSRAVMKLRLKQAFCPACCCASPDEILCGTAQALEQETGLVIQINPLPEQLYEIVVVGAGGHASTPENLKNALTGILKFFSVLPLGESKLNDALLSLARMFPYGEYTGESLGISMEDEIAGKLTVSFDILKIEKNKLKGTFDCRTPLCAAKENVLDVAVACVSAAGFTVVDASMNAPHYIPEDSLLVQTLLDSYEAVMGVRKNPLAIGGQTYIHGFPNAVAFGCMEEDVDNHIHGQDEFIDIDHLIDSACILAEAFIRI